MKPSTDQVFQKTLRGFGRLVRCVSRSAMWMPLTPTRCINAAHSSRVFGCVALRRISAARLVSARFTSEETMPGLAPQQETAVGVPAGRARLAANVISRSA